MFEILRVYGVNSLIDLANALFVDSEITIDSHDIERLRAVRNKYLVGTIEGGRQIERPVPSLHFFQKAFHKCLILCKPQFPSYLMTFRSAIENARRHKGYKATVTLDITGYYQSTASSKVYRGLRNLLGVSDEIARILLSLLTYERRLPTGAPSSPIVSFLATKEMWDRVDALCLEYGCFFTLYMDDLCVSGEQVSGELIWRIKQLLFVNGYRTSRRKEKRFRPGGIKEITGVVVNRASELRMPSRIHLARKCIFWSLFIYRNISVFEASLLFQVVDGIDGYQKGIERRVSHFYVNDHQGRTMPEWGWGGSGVVTNESR